MNQIKPPILDAKDRINNIDEIEQTYTSEQAVLESIRCLSCKDAPCSRKCPVEMDIPAFITAIKENDFEKAKKIIELHNFLGDICGRVCPQELQCQSTCVKGIKGEPISIGRLERFVCDQKIKTLMPEDERSDKRVAIIGSGPAGLTCAAAVSLKIKNVDIYEASSDAGGVLRYGIPEFRLPNRIIDKKIRMLKKFDVNFLTDTSVGKDIFFAELKEKYDAVFIAGGAEVPKTMDIKGIDLTGVYNAGEILAHFNTLFLEHSHHSCSSFEEKNVAVIGAGNVAMDAASVALRLGAKSVKIIYRRTLAEAPARQDEIEHAKDEGAEFVELAGITEIFGADRVEKVIAKKMTLGEPDEDGRRVPIETDKVIEIPVDCVIMAIGQDVTPVRIAGLEQDERGRIIVDDRMRTSIPNVYAGGDITRGSATVILAMRDGRIAGEEIVKSLE